MWTRARIAGLDVLLVSGRSHAEAFRRTRNYYRENRIDAAVVPGHFVSLLEDPIDMPLVLLLTEPHEVPWPSVVLDPKPGIDEAIAHLRELGHRELLWVHEAPPFEAMRERGRMVEAAAGHAVATANIAELKRHTAVFCYNDRLALGVMAALQRAGKRIPEDVSLVGFDDLQGVNTIPRLTSVSHRLDDIGAAAVEIALRMVDHPEQMPNLRGSVKTLTSRLVVGKSTGKP
jgi:DNA-binding LacI/PurR family transcriptional regulator